MDNLKPEIKSAARGSKMERVSTKGLDIIIIGIISMIFALCPLFFTGLASQGIGFEKMIFFYFFVLIGIVAWVTKGVIVGELNLKRTPFDIPILALIAAFIVSTILSVSSKDSLLGSYGNSAKSLVALIIFVLFYYLVVNNIDARKIKIFFWSFLGSASAVVIFSLLQLKGIFLFPMAITKSISFNPLGSLSGLTMYLVIMLPLFIVGIAQIKEIAPAINKALIIPCKVFFGLMALGAMVILALLNGFTFWPAAIVGVVILLMFFLAKIIKISNNNLLIPLAAFLALIIFLVLGNFNIINLQLPAEVSLSRTASWNIAKESIKDNPVFGSGPSTFYYSFSKYKDMVFNSSPLWNIRFDSASGSIFELLTSVGIVGALAAVIIFLIGLSISFLTLIKSENKEVNSILLALFASFITAMIFSLLFSVNNSLLLTIILVAVLSVSASLVMYPERFKDLKLSFRASPKYALALAAIFLSVSAGVVVLFTMGLKMYLADIYARNSVLAATNEQKIVDLNRAIALAPYQDVYYLSQANNYMALANQEAISGQGSEQIQNNLSLAIETGKKSVDISPNKAANNESLALIYENASFYTRGALEWAETYYKKVGELEPTNPTPYLRLALVNMARSNVETDQKEKEFYIDEAIKKYDEAIAKKSDLAAAHYGKAIAYEKLNKIDESIDNLKKANLVSQGNLDYRFELGRLFYNRGVTSPKMAQTDPKQIAENDINPDGTAQGETGENISVQSNSVTGAVIKRNEDLNNAEQLFLSILQQNPNHANSLYSLAVLYMKIGERDNTKIMVDKLLEILPEDATKEAVRKQFESL